MTTNVQNARDGGGAIGGSFRDLANQHARVMTAENVQAYKQLPQTMTALEQALETAIALDKQKATTFWQEAGELLQHGFNYWSDKRRFEREVEALVAAAKANMKELRTLVDFAITKLGVPDELKTHVEHWRNIAKTVEPTMDSVPTLRAVQGWSGPNADNYGTMVGVQGEASTEFRPMPSGVASAVEHLVELNQWILAITYGYVDRAKNQSSVCVMGGENEFYANTANVNGAVLDCLARIPGQVDAAKKQGTRVGDLAVELQRTPIVIQQGWPRGMSQAGQQGRAGSFGNVATPTASTSIPGGSNRRAEGVQR